jgi:hypothetical protein
VKRRVGLMTADRNLHDINTILHLLAHWHDLTATTQNYGAHRLRLLYIAITKGWPAALYYDQQGTDEFLHFGPEFWTSYQPPLGRAAQRGAG